MVYKVLTQLFRYTQCVCVCVALISFAVSRQHADTHIRHPFLFKFFDFPGVLYLRHVFRFVPSWFRGRCCYVFPFPWIETSKSPLEKPESTRRQQWSSSSLSKGDQLDLYIRFSRADCTSQVGLARCLGKISSREPSRAPRPIWIFNDDEITCVGPASLDIFNSLQ